MFTFYHNPKCSKSREGLELLKKKGVTITIKEYLREGLAENEVFNLSKLLGLKPEEFIRKKEDIYKDLKLSEKKLNTKQWCKIIAENPKLLERPILSDGKKAVIGRPSENLLKLI
jgi:arsenate reductase (glutaredoxin)